LSTIIQTIAFASLEANCPSRLMATRKNFETKYFAKNTRAGLEEVNEMPTVAEVPMLEKYVYYLWWED
jgi:hypothetical protein